VFPLQLSTPAWRVTYDEAVGTAAVDALGRGRAAYDQQVWGVAYTALAAAAELAPLEPDDLVRLSTAATLTGRDEEGDELYGRAYQAFVARGDVAGAARTAFWLGMRLQNLGDPVRGEGWLARARRLLDERPQDCAEVGYLLVARGREAGEAGDVPGALALCEQALQIGERFGEPDLVALARLGLGIGRMRAGSPAEGLACLDEVMIAVEAREVSPLVAGILYCNVINVCHEVFDLRRAQHWTEGLTRWCASQPDVVPFRGQCQVHRAQILQLHGAWPAAMDIARSVADARAGRSASVAIGGAFYCKAEVYRLRGEFAQAEEAYREASRCGQLAEPGLARMRLAQGRHEAAAANISRAIEEAGPPTQRSRLLPAYVEIMLAAGDMPAAERGAQELVELANQLGAPFLKACAAHALGSVKLAEGHARGALAELRSACSEWQQLDAPYEAARSRELIGLAAKALGDDDHATLELDAALWAFQQLGAVPDAARVESHLRSGVTAASGGLTQREVQVLRLVAAGKSNRAIATELVLSEKTVARHLSNIFTKLGLSSRSAATAYAYEHALV
jgi:DNA-binding CsgD family transcriptional regulator